ncbi:MAG: D-alanine--D-alanine ligase family protein, partial [Candidatus Moraniibacteriota bacterium]
YWHSVNPGHFLSHESDPELIGLEVATDSAVALTPESKGEIVNLDAHGGISSIDVAFPILHGTFGEDGTIQGLLKLAGVPFVGSGVLGSAVGMDKDVMKRLLRDAGIPQAKFIVCTEKSTPSYREAVQSLGTPIFVKPANAGSSIGVSKVRTEEEYETAIQEAFLYDRKIIIEENVSGREIECAVLGNDHPIASVPGEVILHQEFYSYEAKYIDADGATIQIPAELSEEKRAEIQALAIRTFQTLSCEGLGRVDLFLKENGEVFVNEINTMPGFTSISMYPKLFEASGIPYPDLIDRLITLAFERFESEKKLKTTRE